MAGLNRWNGSAWVPVPFKRWNGSAWVYPPVKKWNGSTWVTISTVVSISGETVTSNGASPRTAGIRVNSTGTMDRRIQAAYSQIDAATDWIIPNSAYADKTYHVRVTGRTGEPLVGSAENTWINVNTSPEWRISDSVDLSSTFTLQISEDGGSTVLASGSYTLNLVNV